LSGPNSSDASCTTSLELEATAEKRVGASSFG
jgi:hypothetical protein